MTLEYPYRIPATYPGTTSFAQWIKTYSTQINTFLGVTTDIAAFGTDDHTSRTIVTVISALLESRYVYQEDRDKTPLSERGDMIIPHIRDQQFVSLRADLEGLKGQLPTVASNDPPAFNFDLDVTEGGYD